MVSEIDPTTPVIFCRRPPIFEESTEYRAKIIEILHLENVSSTEGHETIVGPDKVDHCERMWIEKQNVPGRSFEVLHLNNCLAPYDCWISAVYHASRPEHVRNRVDIEGRLIRVDPLIRWSREEVREFMRAHDLPYHKMADRKYDYAGTPEGTTNEFYHF
jgi:phosphoadenosine phosphosulfate reductase